MNNNFIAQACNNEYKLPNSLYDKVKIECENDMLYNMLITEGINVFLTGNGGCVDDKTEFLSMNGWKKISEYKPFDSVAEFIIGTESIEFNRPKKYIKFDSKEPFKEVSTVNGLKMLLTDEHKVLYTKNNEQFYNCFLKDIDEQHIKPTDMCIPTKFFNKITPQRCLKNNNIEFEYCAFIVKLFGLTLFDDEKHKVIVINREYEEKLRNFLPTIMETANISRVFDTLTVKLDRQVYDIISHTQVYGLTDVTLKKLYNVITELTNFEETGVLMLDCPESADEVQFVAKASSEYDIDVVDGSFVVMKTKNSERNTIDSIIYRSEEEYDVTTKYCFTTRSGYWLARRDGKIFVTGNSGKTYLTRSLMKKFDENNISYGITASTGVAAKNMDEKGSTINKFLGLGVISSIQFYYRKKFFNEEELRSKISNLDVLIIDEISMNSAEFLDIIFLHLKEFGFKGTILIVGDFLQLSPVMDDDLINHSYYLAFQAKNWNFITVFLDRMKRTSDITYTKHLNDARIGKCTREFLDYLYAKSLDAPHNSHITEESLGDDYTKLFATNREASVVNQRCLDLIEEELHTFNGFWMENTSFVYYRGEKDKEIKRSQHMETILVSDVVEYKVSERVMLIVNDKDDRFHNGDTGVIIDISSYYDSKLKMNLPAVTIETKTGKKILVKPNEFKFEEVIGKNYEHIDSFYQLPFIPAYAITIHKSQGLSIEKVYIDFRNFFTYSQAYVALSRVINPDNLYVKNVNPHKFMAIPQAIWFYTNIYDINVNVYQYFHTVR